MGRKERTPAPSPWVRGQGVVGPGPALTGASPVEALHQLGHVVGEEALAEHDAHVGVAALVQHVRGLSHEQGEAVGRSGAQLHVAQQAQQLRGTERWDGVPAARRLLGEHPASLLLTLSVSWELRGW